MIKATAALDLAIRLLEASQRISALVMAAQAEGRESLNPEEFRALMEDDERARDRLVAAIEEANREGR